MELAPQTTSVTDVIDRRSMGVFQIITVTICGLVLVLDGFDAQTINFLSTSIAQTTHISIKTFGPILSMSLIGLMIAALATGPIADRVGRKWPVVFSMFSFAIFSLLTAHATTRKEFLVLRFLTGLGLGGAMPNVVALASEYMPRRLLPVLVPVLFVGMPLGGMICGFASASMIPRWGWPSVFYLGGILPLVIALILIGVLPESIQFLAARQKNPRKIAMILARISPEFARPDAEIPIGARDKAEKGVPVIDLFLEGRAVGTILLWIPYFMNLLLIYFISGWLPALLREEGMSVSAAARAAAFVSVGGIFGCLIEGPLLKWFGSYTILIGEYALGGALIAALALVPASYVWTLAMTFGVGLMIIGSQGGLNALAANFYPVSMRSTGVGWALGVGRVGSIVGPWIGGTFLLAGWETRQMLLFAAVVAVVAFIAILASKIVRRSASPYAALKSDARPL